VSEAKGGKIATAISVLALLVSFAALRLQFKEREDRIADRAEVLDYEIGSERVDPKQYAKQVVLSEPQKPAVLEARQFKEFRFRLNN